MPSSLLHKVSALSTLVITSMENKQRLLYLLHLNGDKSNMLVFSYSVTVLPRGL